MSAVEVLKKHKLVWRHPQATFGLWTFEGTNGWCGAGWSPSEAYLNWTLSPNALDITL